MENEEKIEQSKENQATATVEQQPKEAIKANSNLNSKKETDLKKFVPLLLTIAIIIGAVGFYLTLFSNPKRVIATGIDKLSSELKKVINYTETNNIIKDNYTLEGNLDIKAESEFLTLLGNSSLEYQAYPKLLSNLSKTKNNFKIVQDKTNKKLFTSIDSSLNNEELISAKYLIENNTEYYFIRGFLNSYINNGTNDFFEALDENATSQENIIYIYDATIKSFKENLKSEYFTKEKEEITIDGKKQKLIKHSLVINNKVAKEIASAILKDLKEDKKATEILTGVNKDFNKSKVKESTTILNDNEEIILTVYTDSLTYSAKLYKLTAKSSNNTTSITYQDTKENKKIEILEDDKIQLVLNIKEETSSKTSIEIMDSKDKKIGEGTIVSTDTNKNITLSVTSSATTIDLSMDSITQEEEKDKKYNVEGNVACKVTSDNMTIIDLNIDIKSTISTDTKIDEDVSNSVLASSVTEQDKTNLSTKMQGVFLKLMS